MYVQSLNDSKELISSQSLVEHEEPLLSLKKFISYFTPPLPEDLSLGGKFIFSRCLLEGPERINNSISTNSFGRKCSFLMIYFQ